MAKYSTHFHKGTPLSLTTQTKSPKLEETLSDKVQQRHGIAAAFTHVLGICARMSLLCLSQIYGSSVLADYLAGFCVLSSQRTLLSLLGTGSPSFYLFHIFAMVSFLPDVFLPISPRWISQLAQASKPSF